MAKVDIFDLRETYPLPDDNHSDTYRDLDGSEVMYTPERVARQVNNVMSKHHPTCGMDDCEMVVHPESQVAIEMAKYMKVPAPEPVMIGRCFIEGPTNPEMLAKNKATDGAMDAPPPFPEQPERRHVGFDIERQNKGQSPYGSGE